MNKKLVFGIVIALVLAAPPTASAATLTNTDEGLVYSARSGEVNRVAIGGGTGSGIPVTEYVAPLDLGDGCALGAPILCPFNMDVVVHLGNMDDVASAVSHAAWASMFAGAGDDDVTADGVWSRVDGGSG